MPVYLRLYACEDLVPDVHFGSKLHEFVEFSPWQKSQLSHDSWARLAAGSAFGGEFPQFFPQVWKALATDRTCMSWTGCVGWWIPAKERDFSTKGRQSYPAVIDTTGT